MIGTKIIKETKALRFVALSHLGLLVFVASYRVSHGQRNLDNDHNKKLVNPPPLKKKIEKKTKKI